MSTSLPASSASAPAAIVRKALQGAVALGLRQIVVQGVSLAGGIALARLLSPAEFGVFGVVSFVLNFLGTLGDVGLGASLIRDGKEPSEHDFRVVFTAQQGLVSIVVAIFWVAAPYLAEAYHLPPDARWLFRYMALSLFAASFQTIPAIRLERHLAFDRLSIAEVTQALVYNGVAVALAYSGFGAASLVLAILARSVVGALVIQVVSRWRISWAWDWPLVKQHLAFGIPYQGISVVSLIKDSITPVMVGLMVGTAAVGYINWAQMVAAYAVIALMAFQRLYLPMFARLQGDRAALGAVVQRVIWATNAICAPLSILTLALFEPFTTIVFGPKWLAAAPYFRLLWAANIVVPTATPVFGLLSALGHSRVALLFALIWMVGTWLFGAPLIYVYGGIGFAIANCLVQVSNFALVYVAKRQVPFTVLRTVFPAWTAAAAVGVVAFCLQRVLPIENVFVLVAYLVAGIALYLAGIATLDRNAVNRAWALFRNDQ
jgi:O-antigen/teichoic acid export membrane protein